jgi:NitT/TauT family transport system substrate-binding protein
MGQDLGIFKKYGLTTDVRNLSPPTDIQAAVSGEAPIVIDGAGGVPAIASGAPLTYIAVPLPTFTQSIYATPQSGIKTIQDLVGKNVGATARGQSSDNALRTVLAKNGIDANKVNIVYLRDDSSILAGLTGGSLQAAIVTSPNTLRARKAGLYEVLFLAPLKLGTINNGIVANKTWAQQHPDTVDSFLKAYLEGIKITLTDPVTTKAAIAKWTKLDDQEMLEETYRTSPPLLRPFPLVDDSYVQNVIDMSPEANVKGHKPAEFYDNSYLQKLQDFAKTLYPEGMPGS